MWMLNVQKKRQLNENNNDVDVDDDDAVDAVLYHQ